MNGARAILITIGDELLIGQTIDTNSAWIAQQLNRMGVDVVSRIAVGDTRDAIVGVLNDQWNNADLFIVTGGLGPTSDDITKPLLCEYFGGKLVVNEEVTTHLRDIFARWNRPIIARNLKQAEVPDNCIVLFNRMGTAPGMWFEKDGKILISLPGVPFEMKHIMEQVALPKLAGIFSGTSIVHKTVCTAGEGESMIAERLLQFEANLPDYIKLAYLPDGGFVRLRLTSGGTDAALLEKETTEKQQELATILQDIVIATEDVPLEKMLGDSVRRLGKTFGTAESCTGGFIGHCITQVPGASEYYMGGIVAYDNEVKENVLGVSKATLEQFGAVSEETVTEMAANALRVLNVDYALAVSGVLGPGGATERVKVGTVWLAAASKDKVSAKVYNFRYDRERNKEMAAKVAMLHLWKLLNNKL